MSNQEVNNTFCLISWEEKRYDIDTLFIDRVLNKEHFYRKIMQNMCNSPRPLFKFGK